MHTGYVANVNGNGARDPMVNLFAVLFLSWFVNAVVQIKVIDTHSFEGWGGGGERSGVG